MALLVIKKTDLIRLSMMFSYLSYIHTYIIYIFIYIHTGRRHLSTLFSGHFYHFSYHPHIVRSPGHCSFTVPEGKLPKASALSLGFPTGLSPSPPPWFLWLKTPKKRIWKQKNLWNTCVFFCKKKSCLEKNDGFFCLRGWIFWTSESKCLYRKVAKGASANHFSFTSLGDFLLKHKYEGL